MNEITEQEFIEAKAVLSRLETDACFVFRIGKDAHANIDDSISSQEALAISTILDYIDNLLRK